MLPDLSSVFAKYERVQAEADALFDRIASQFPQCVTCCKGCSDCCHAVFDLSLVEAMRINQVFLKTFPYGPERSAIVERASEIDRKLTKAKRELYQAEKNGEKPEEIMRNAAKLRMPCPLLNADNECILYEARPITCRLYGVPENIGGKSHVCGFSKFESGVAYPAVQLGKLQAKLEDLSREIGTLTGSRFELQEVYVPLSMALLTRYDDAYLGIGKAKEDD